MNSQCTDCYDRFYLDSNTCREVNPLCKGYNSSNGACTSCYVGYIVEGQSCVIATNTDIYCRTYSQSNPFLCEQCYGGFFLLGGKCTVRDDQCANYSQEQARCISCYQGYTLLPDTYSCVVSSSVPTNLNCLQVQNSRCVKCVNGYFLNATSSLCQVVDPQCRTHAPSTG